MALLQSQQALLEEQCRIEMQNDQISQGGNGPATSTGFNTAPASDVLGATGTTGMDGLSTRASTGRKTTGDEEPGPVVDGMAVETGVLGGAAATGGETNSIGQSQIQLLRSVGGGASTVTGSSADAEQTREKAQDEAQVEVVADLQEQLANQKARADDAEKDLAEAKSQIVTLQSQISAMQEQMSKVSAQKLQLETQFAELELAAASAASASPTNLESQVARSLFNALCEERTAARRLAILRDLPENASATDKKDALKAAWINGRHHTFVDTSVFANTEVPALLQAAKAMSEETLRAYLQSGDLEFLPPKIFTLDVLNSMLVKNDGSNEKKVLVDFSAQTDNKSKSDGPQAVRRLRTVNQPFF